MKIGVVIHQLVGMTISAVPRIEDAGYNYIELGVDETLNPEITSEQDFKSLAKKMKSYGLTPEVFNCFLPSNIKVVGHEHSENKFRHYANIVIPRAKELGAKLIVWGSASSRNIPVSFPRKEAWSQFRECLSYVDSLCLEYKIKLALEPLSRPAANWLHTIEDCLEIARGFKEIGVIGDTQHMYFEELDIGKSVLGAGEKLVHVHFRDIDGKAPCNGKFDLKSYAEVLKKANYDGRGSIEAPINLDSDELENCRKYLKGLFDSVN